MPNLEDNDRREKERDLLREVQRAQAEFHSSEPDLRAAALERYLRAVNRFSQFVLGRQPRDGE